MREVFIETEYIRIDQLLKYADIVGSGGEAKILIKEGLVRLNGEVVTQRGKKIRNKDIIEIDDIKIKVLNSK